MTSQPPLLDGAGASLPGPQFVPRPGWGGRLADWFAHNAYTLIFRLVIISAVVLLARSLWLAPSSRQAVVSTSPSPSPELSRFIIKANPGDGMTNLAARALDLYVAVQSDIIRLDAAQHLYAVDALARRICWCPLQAGQTVQFMNADIASVIISALKLTPAQHAAWSRLLR